MTRIHDADLVLGEPQSISSRLRRFAPEFLGYRHESPQKPTVGNLFRNLV